MGFLTAIFFRDCTLFLQRRIRRKKMDDAFIQSLQITQGREERCSSLPWVCFSFFMLLFLFHEIFSPNGGSSTAEKILRGKMAHRRDKSFYVEQIPVWETAACPMGQKRYVFGRQVPVRYGASGRPKNVQALSADTQIPDRTWRRYPRPGSPSAPADRTDPTGAEPYRSTSGSHSRKN